MPVMRVVVPFTMIFLTDFRIFLFILFPMLCIVENTLDNQYKKLE